MVDRLTVEARQGLVDGLLEHRAPTHPLLDDAAGHLPLPEAGDLDRGPDRLQGRVDARLEFGIRDLDGQLDPRRVDGLDGALHRCFLLRNWANVDERATRIELA